MPKNLYYINKYFVGRFGKALQSEGFSKATIKNYITDINQFLKWRDENHNGLLDDNSTKEYSQALAKSFRASSVKRKLSAINKYIAFENTEISLLPKENSRLSKISYAPLFVGIFLMFTIPAIGYSLNSRSSNINEDKIEADIPANTIISNSTKAEVYNLDSSKGLRVVLANDSFDPSAGAENTTFTITKTLETDSTPQSPTQGVGSIYKGRSEAIIVNDIISPRSFISLVPTSSTGNQTLYIETQADGYAIVKVDNLHNQDITFQWKIDNTEVYHSIL